MKGIITNQISKFIGRDLSEKGTFCNLYRTQCGNKIIVTYKICNNNIQQTVVNLKQLLSQPQQFTIKTNKTKI